MAPINGLSSWERKRPKGSVAAGRGIYILYEDVKSCPCEDVHVLWSILVDSHNNATQALKPAATEIEPAVTEGLPTCA
ncbi:hypothetical protein SAY87_018350 [Trapa incisa]|uniref:Uncharacterized protein n=1 Tax=Trapa incisa TaxID=236973 RepID=A0AAN7L894_9MYRT|nr:hypothetical protein SAY87_018350 [Trapa incisa]